MARKKVLLVDDSLVNRMVLKGMLDAEYDVLEAEDGDECLKTLEDHPTEISLVILDAWMPRMDGFTVLHEMDERSWLNRIPVIVATADTTEETEMRLLDLGAVDVLHKPYSAGIVLRKAENAIRRQELIPLNVPSALYITKGGNRSLLNCMGSFLYEYSPATGAEHMDPYYAKYLAREWSAFSIVEPSRVKQLVYRPDYPAFKAFLKRDDIDIYETMDARLMSAQGSYEWFRIGLTKYVTPDGERKAVTFHNVSAERKANARLEFLASHDSLTQILNQQAFAKQVKELMEQYPEKRFFMIYLAVDRFSILNQLHGAAESDQVLKYLAVKLQESVEAESNCVCCRLHMDHFAVFGAYNKSAVKELRSYLQESLDLYPIKFAITLSAGVYEVDDSTANVGALLDRAEEAQKTVAGNYSVHVAYYNEAMRKRDESKRLIILEMDNALRDGQFEMFLQPKCDMETGEIIGSEALVRWRHPTRGMISPGVFIPVMEGNGFISQIDSFILDQACRFQRRQIDQGRQTCPISVNISRADLYDTHLLARILKIVDAYSLSHALIEFELTESSFVFDNNKIGELSSALQRNGFRILMDDFGSGYSSLNTLKDIDVDVLKIDLKFLQDSDKNARAQLIMEFVVQMALDMKLDTIVEGVETVEQVSFLKSIGVRYAQGFYYHRPMPASDFERLLPNCGDAL